MPPSLTTPVVVTGLLTTLHPVVIYVVLTVKYAHSVVISLLNHVKLAYYYYSGGRTRVGVSSVLLDNC